MNEDDQLKSNLSSATIAMLRKTEEKPFVLSTQVGEDAAIVTAGACFSTLEEAAQFTAALGELSWRHQTRQERDAHSLLREAVENCKLLITEFRSKSGFPLASTFTTSEAANAEELLVLCATLVPQESSEAACKAFDELATNLLDALNQEEAAEKLKKRNLH